MGLKLLDTDSLNGEDGDFSHGGLLVYSSTERNIGRPSLREESTLKKILIVKQSLVGGWAGPPL